MSCMAGVHEVTTEKVQVPEADKTIKHAKRADKNRANVSSVDVCIHRSAGCQSILECLDGGRQDLRHQLAICCRLILYCTCVNRIKEYCVCYVAVSTYWSRPGRAHAQLLIT